MDGLAEVVEGGLGIDWGQLDPFDINLSVELP